MEQSSILFLLLSTEEAHCPRSLSYKTEAHPHAQKMVVLNGGKDLCRLRNEPLLAGGTEDGFYYCTIFMMAV